jgi:translocator protein
MAIDILKLIISIVICQLAGLVGSIFNFKAIPRWYSKLKKPAFNPPNWIFGPVWTILYLLMGISMYLVWNAGFSLFSTPLIIFGLQLLLNISWSALFFGAKKPAMAFVEILFLWMSILYLIFIFYPISQLASYLLIPYLLWVGFASLLNWKLWTLNK